MKSLLLMVALATAAPVAFTATESAAQVLTGRGASRATAPARRAPPPVRGLTREEQAELRDAQAEVAAIDARIAEYQRLNAAGALTEDARARWEADAARRADLQLTVEILIALRDE